MRHYVFADGSGTISVAEYKTMHQDGTLSHILRDEHLLHDEHGTLVEVQL